MNFKTVSFWAAISTSSIAYAYEDVAVHSLGSDDLFRTQGAIPAQFGEGCRENSEALILSETDDPASGAIIHVDTTALASGCVEIRFNPEEKSLSRGIIVSMGSSGNTKLKIELKSGKLRAAIYGRHETIALQGPVIDPNRWYDVALMWSEENGSKLFLDGEIVAENTSSSTLWSLNSKEIVHIGDSPDFVEGKEPGNHFTSSENNFVGRIMDLRISTDQNPRPKE